MDRADETWNRAALGGTIAARPGDRALSAVLDLHGLAAPEDNEFCVLRREPS